MERTEIHHSKNTLHNAHIDAQGNVIVGDNNIVINLKEAAQYIALEETITALKTRQEKTQDRIAKYPDDEEFQQDLLTISQALNRKKKELETLKTQVIELAVQFTTIPINTERLRKAEAHFKKGEFAEARAIFEVEKAEMANELNTAIHKENLGKKMQEKGLELETQAQEERLKLANEYLLFARLTAINFELADRFKITCAHFEKSLQANKNIDNTFAYAHFLQKHHQNNKATPLYQQALDIYRTLAQNNPQTFLPDVATTLNNLAILHSDKNEFQKAENAYDEALGIYRKLAQNNPQSFLPNVAGTLNNLGALHKAKNKFQKAEKAYDEALDIYRKLAQNNPQSFLSNVAMTLNNLASLYSDKNQFGKAEIAYNKALDIRRKLAQSNPQTFLPDVATILNNSAVLHRAKNEFQKAEIAYNEALDIYRTLAQNNPQTFLPDVATTLNNLAILHSDKNEFQKAENAYDEALGIYRKLAQNNPQSFLPNVAGTLNNLGALHKAKNKFQKAEKAYDEALDIYRKLAQNNPQSFLSNVAMTLNNLASLYSDKNQFGKAEIAYNKALDIRRKLAQSNPQTFLPDVAMTLINLSIYFLQNKQDNQRSFELVHEAIGYLLPLQHIGYIQNYLKVAFQIINALGIDIEQYLQELLNSSK